MVDVSAKAETERQAVAGALVKMSARTLRAIKRNPKGDPLEIARIAGIAAAKRAAELIPLCHPLLLSHIEGTPGCAKMALKLPRKCAPRGKRASKWKP